MILQRNLDDLFGEPDETAGYLVTMDFSEFSYAFSMSKTTRATIGDAESMARTLGRPLRQAFGLIVDRGYSTNSRPMTDASTSGA